MFEKFFADHSFDFETRSLFGDIHYGAGDIGEMLTAVANIEDGNATSWVKEWRELAERIQQIGQTSLAAGHKVSARNAYLRAVYYAASYVFVDGTENPAPQLEALFASHRECFDQHVSLLDPPAIPIAVPYEDTELRGYLFVPAADGVARPTVILNNGSDAAFTFLWPGLGQPGLARGYNTVIFDGPGQQSMLFQRNIPFRPDWEHVITPWSTSYPTERKSTHRRSSSTGPAKPATGCPERRRSSIASRRSSPTRVSSTSLPAGRRTSLPRWSRCWKPRTKKASPRA
jgi:hypothetical protein